MASFLLGHKEIRKGALSFCMVEFFLQVWGGVTGRRRKPPLSHPFVTCNRLVSLAFGQNSCLCRFFLSWFDRLCS